MRVMFLLLIFDQDASCHCQIFLQEHMEAGNRTHIQTVAPMVSLKCPAGMVMVSHNAYLSPLYLAQSKAATMQKALRRCTCSIGSARACLYSP